MYQPTEDISTCFALKGIRHRVEETDHISYVLAKFSGDGFVGIPFYFISSDNTPDVTMRVDPLAAVPEGKDAEALRICNTLNAKYRYFSFYVRNGNLLVQYDFPRELAENDVGMVAYEMAQRMSGILESAYPAVMRAFWTGQVEDVDHEEGESGEQDDDDEDEDEDEDQDISPW